MGEAGQDPDGIGYIEWEYADDAALSISYARSMPGASSVVLLGHSLGGTVAPRIAVENDVDALIMVAGSARRFAQISIDQNRYLAARMEQTEELEAQLAGLVAFFEAVLHREVPPDTLVQPGLPVAYYYALDEYQPQDYLPRFDGPVLITQGDADFQALADADYEALRSQFGGEPGFDFYLFEGLNHLLMPATNPDAGVADYARPGFVSESFFRLLANWIEGAPR
jgi:pimeloyl-ACP methyl ester carboxylesterase